MALKLPDFPIQLMASNWVYKENKVHDSKLHSASLCIRATLAAMCGMHIHSLSGKKKPDIEAICEAKYHELVAALKIKYPDASVVEFLPYVTMKKVKKISGHTIYRLSMNVRKICTNSFGKLWEDALGPDRLPPSGRSWEWVSQRVLVMLYREKKKDDRPLPANQGNIQCVWPIKVIMYACFFVCRY